MSLLESPDEEGLSRSEQFVDKIKDLMDYQYCLDRNDRDLFEYLGDRSEDPYLSLEWYKLGIFNPKISWMRPWPSLAFKYMGAAKMAGVSPSEETKAALDRLWEHSDPKKVKIPIGGLQRLDRVQERWSIGRAAIWQGEYNFGSYSI